jgi:hypothetical protein
LLSTIDYFLSKFNEIPEKDEESLVSENYFFRALSNDHGQIAPGDGLTFSPILIIIILKAGGGSDEHPGLTGGACLYDESYPLFDRPLQQPKAYPSPALFLFCPFFRYVEHR